MASIRLPIIRATKVIWWLSESRTKIGMMTTSSLTCIMTKMKKERMASVPKPTDNPLQERSVWFRFLLQLRCGRKFPSVVGIEIRKKKLWLRSIVRSIYIMIILRPPDSIKFRTTLTLLPIFRTYLPKQYSRINRSRMTRSLLKPMMLMTKRLLILGRRIALRPSNRKRLRPRRSIRVRPTLIPNP